MKKLKRDEKRYEEYKRKARERSSMKYKIVKSLRMLKTLRKHRSDCQTPASAESVYIEITSSDNSDNEFLTDDGSPASSVKRNNVGYKLPNYSRLNTEDRKKIIKLHEEGNTYRSIADMFNKTPASIYQVVKTFRDTGRVVAKRIYIKKKTVSTPNPKLVSEGHSTPTTSTIRNRLYEDKEHGRVRRKNSFMSKINLEKRMKFYADHVFKPENFWEQILWTDESIIKMQHAEGYMYVWRKQNEAFSFKCKKPRFESSEKGLLVWGCISAYGVGKVVVLEEQTTSQLYLNLMKDIIVPEGKRLIGEDFIIQQDNAPIHKDEIVSKYITGEGINVLEWPPESPDLSPIENVWAWLRAEIKEKRPQNLNELRNLILDVWPTFPPELCRKYILSMPTRLAKMSQNNGGRVDINTLFT